MSEFKEIFWVMQIHFEYFGRYWEQFYDRNL